MGHLLAALTDTAWPARRRRVGRWRWPRLVLLARAAGAALRDPPPARDPRLALQLERARGGDPAALEALAERTLRMALRTAGAVMRGRDEAGDVAQEVAIEVLRDLRHLRDPARFDAWVHRITVRRTLKVLNKSRARREAEEPLTDVIEDRGAPAAEGVVEQLAMTQAVRQGLRALPARQRLAIALRYGHDLSEEGVAEALGCRPGSAAALLSRGRALLRDNPALAGFAPEVRVEGT